MNKDFKLTIKKAEISDKQLLANLLELYEYDFSEFGGKDVAEDGKYGYKYLDSYWTESNRHPFIIKINEKIAGFVLVNLNDPLSKEQNIHSIAEFFVMRKYRKQGIGEKVAEEIFNTFPGKWEVRQLIENKAAQLFWQKIIYNYTNRNFQSELEEKGPVLKFDNTKKL